MKTVLFEKHVALGAKMVDFAGWQMPVHYTGMIQEHLVVRNKVGIFDVSHMGRILVTGQEAEEFLDYISTNTIQGKSDYSATYTVLCRASGKCVDDVMVYRQNQKEFFIIVNASNRQKDLEHIREQAKAYLVTVSDRFKEDGILAIQGPLAQQLMRRLFPQVDKLKPMHFVETPYQNAPLIISCTGYTGAGGYEIYAPSEQIVSLWDLILEAGKSEGIQPIGLGARDTLRLEMGFALYGHELNEETAPTESVSAWTVKFEKSEFVGKPALVKLEGDPNKRYAYGVVLEDKCIARQGYPVLRYGKLVGKVTSGSYSPVLNKSIAIILIDEALHEQDIVEIQIRQNLCVARVTKLPFLKSRPHT